MAKKSKVKIVPLVAPAPSPDCPVCASEAIVREASRWIGTREVGNNGGPIVEAFQRAVDGKASGEPWCMAFVQYVLDKSGFNPLFDSELCLSVWINTRPEYRVQNPEPGCVVIWRKKGTTQGHCGIVKSVQPGYILTIEGNTGSDMREGDGVYQKLRAVPTHEGFELLGFLRPWRDA